MKRSELRSDPETTRLWQQRSRETAIDRARGREGMSSMELRRAGIAVATVTDSEGNGRTIHVQPIGRPVLKRRQRPRRDSIPGIEGFALRVFELYGPKCVACPRRATQGHHVVPVRTLFARGEDYAFTHGADERNGAPVCPQCHRWHEDAFRRLRRDELPAGAVAWAYDHDFGWVVDDERTYPVAA